MEEPDELLYVQDLASKAAGGDRIDLEKLLNHPIVLERASKISSIILKRYGSKGIYKNAEDLRQELYTRLLTNMPVFDSRAFFTNWLNTLAKKTYIERRRRSLEEREIVNETDATEESSNHNEDLLNKMALREALDKLNPEQRQILRLRVEGLTLEEIAKELKVSKSKVHRILSATMQVFIKAMEGTNARMKQTQREIEQEKELTRTLISELQEQ